MGTGLTTGSFDRRLGAAELEWTGHLAQVYEHAAVARADGPQPDVILQHPDRDLLPRGIQVPWDLLRPRPGERLRLAGGRLWLTGLLGSVREIGLAGAGVDLGLGPCGPGCRLALDRQIAALGLPERVRLILGQAEAVPDLNGRECALLGVGLDGLVAALMRPGQSSACRLALLGLVGLGAGSTPAGDDAIVGVTAAAIRFAGIGWLPDGSPDSIRAALAGLEAGATTRAGRAMLEQAGTGCFPLALVRLVRSLGNPGASPAQVVAAQAHLMHMGATSGQDMLAGVLATARAVSNRRI